MNEAITITDEGRVEIDWYAHEELLNEATSLKAELKDLRQAMKHMTHRADRGIRAIMGLRIRAIDARLDYVNWALEACDSPALAKVGYVPF